MLRHCHTRRRHQADAETTERFPPRGDTEQVPGYKLKPQLAERRKLIRAANQPAS